MIYVLETYAEAVSKLDNCIRSEFCYITDCTEDEDMNLINVRKKDISIPPIYTLKGDLIENTFTADESGMIFILLNFLFNSFLQITYKIFVSYLYRRIIIY